MKRKNSGFTLIELVITMGIIGVVSILAFSIYLFSTRVYAKGENQTVVQFDARIAADAITRELRFAFTAELLNSVPSTVTDDSCYIYKETSGGKDYIMYKDAAVTRKIAEFDSVTLYFSTSGTNKILYFNVQGQYKDQSFNIDSKVLPLNFNTLEKIVNTTGDVVRFTKVGVSINETIFFNPTPPNKMANTSYNHTFTVTGGTAPYTYTLEAGALPPGLTLNTNAETSQITGTPTAPGEYVFKIKVVDASSPQRYGSRTFNVIIGNPAISALNVATGINSGTYLFTPPVTGATSVKLPDVPTEYMVVIESSSDTSVIALDGTITTPSSTKIVSLTLRVISLIDNSYALTNPISVEVKPVTNMAPEASNVTIAGSPKVGGTVTGTYTYFDAENNAQGASEYKWFYDNKLDGKSKVEIAGATSVTFTINSTYNGKYLFFSVKPVASAGTLNGVQKFSEPVLVSAANTAPKANNVRISLTDGGDAISEAKVGDILYGEYTYEDDENSIEGGTVVQWYIGNKNNATTAISGATSGIYTVQEGDVGQYIYFKVVPKSYEAPTDGTEVLSSNVKISN